MNKFLIYVILPAPVTQAQVSEAKNLFAKIKDSSVVTLPHTVPVSFERVTIQS